MHYLSLNTYHEVSQRVSESLCSLGCNGRVAILEGPGSRVNSVVIGFGGHQSGMLKDRVKHGESVKDGALAQP